MQTITTKKFLLRLPGIILLIMAIACSTGYAQGTNVQGRVTDGQTGEPLPGVTVGVKGTTAGTSTDASGKFSLKVEKGQVIAFSYVGYQSVQVTYAGEPVLNIKLGGQSTGLNEVVVVGYGTQSRSNITSSMARLDTAVLKNVPRANVGSALQGTVPGLQVVNASGQPGANPVILLRGGAS
ncbi:MAG TPA: carboxypeptidase-like regulatory domain-containing protein, partial [Chitinophagaceae bacterium]